jgi:hypothetical protein
MGDEQPGQLRRSGLRWRRSGKVATLPARSGSATAMPSFAVASFPPGRRPTDALLLERVRDALARAGVTVAGSLR